VGSKPIIFNKPMTHMCPCVFVILQLLLSNILKKNLSAIFFV
jgi:hypothetical protein